ncbi:hypothetical protein EVAR_60876_1 [Eumeta japonica]|uniref:Uncharacterized protein n=1 Tax=Eumeta variegata TaxID=151549 RepID=A0A4C1YJZ8_EUMVA|nr:hypothetical protein EVAR_60876_1 [Eumeta japonica]
MQWRKVLHRPRASEIENDRSYRLSVCPVTDWADMSMPVVAAGIVWLCDPKIRSVQSEGDSTAESSKNCRKASPAPASTRGKRKTNAALSDDSNSVSTLRGSDEEEENDCSIL